MIMPKAAATYIFRNQGLVSWKSIFPLTRGEVEWDWFGDDSHKDQGT